MVGALRAPLRLDVTTSGQLALIIAATVLHGAPLDSGGILPIYWACRCSLSPRRFRDGPDGGSQVHSSSVSLPPRSPSLPSRRSYRVVHAYHRARPSRAINKDHKKVHSCHRRLTYQKRKCVVIRQTARAEWHQSILRGTRAPPANSGDGQGARGKE